ncbi:ABC transporter ATP-binding protein [Candidatus Aminicenantes bacterium AC-335-K20]|jgi:ABC-2 type transport system ATP-binding protein|nr:ABC transporter ATP-binding protein [SCandidatus Aminicenantes bacterium Aminicenantia_JdfR_composite]MCP2597568.1 ABC transporter ATP-binding protein [Candidatus Aminicenantes bacterium AC-335-G13]MCP2619436.1 ABC transporter ATP-binding protein [Candidatus Aminicenantes bacterium AC-335-K20]
MSNLQQNIISIKNLFKSFGNLFSRKLVLKNINLDILKGEVFGLIGPNGAGKTTLMGCMLGLLKIDSGEILINGRSPLNIEIKRNIGYLPERIGFYKTMTGKEFLIFQGKLFGLPNPVLKKRVDALLRELELKDVANCKIRIYSRGMLQRLSWAQALIHNPDILFLDEPAAGMDPSGIIRVRNLILQLKKEGKTIFLNSHKLSEVEKVCDRIAFIDKGEIIHIETLRRDHLIYKIEYSETKKEFITLDMPLIHGLEIYQINNSFIKIKVENERALFSFLKHLLNKGVKITEVIKEKVDIEKFFLD